MGRRNIELPIEQIKSDYESGLNTYKLGRKYGVSESTIRNRLRGAGVQLRIVHRNKKKEISTEDKRAVLVEFFGEETADKLIENFESESSNVYVIFHHRVIGDLPMEQIKSEYESGASIYSLALKYGVGQRTISRKLREAGVQIRVARPLPAKIELPIEQIKSDYESGMSPKELGEKYGVSRRTIKRRLKEAEKELS